MKKRIVCSGMSMVMALSLLTGCGSNKQNSSAVESLSSGNGGKVLNIYCFDDSFKDLVEDYYIPTGRLPDDVKLNWITVPNADNAYQNSLDEALLKQSEVPADERIDMFIVEADYALKYAQSNTTLDVKKDLGFTDDQLSQMYDYTKQIVTTDDGSIKGLSAFASPGLFTYRRSIAKAVLGTDDPVKVQECLNSWEKFNDVAEKAKEKGYKMLSGYSDSYRVFSNNVSGSWVKDNKIQIDENIKEWIKQTKEYTDKGYNNKHALWSDGWTADQGSSGDVFGFFLPPWGINFTLVANSLDKAVADGGKEEVGNGIFGDYAVCQGPESWFWGGSWYCTANGTDNINEIRDLLSFFCCEKESMKKMATETIDFSNNKEAMQEVANSDYTSAFLGGQNPYGDFCESAENIDMKYTSIYDQGLNDGIGKAMGDYFDGNVDYDTALDNFYKIAQEKYPELEK